MEREWQNYNIIIWQHPNNNSAKKHQWVWSLGVIVSWEKGCSQSLKLPPTYELQKKNNLTVKRPDRHHLSQVIDIKTPSSGSNQDLVGGSEKTWRCHFCDIPTKNASLKLILRKYQTNPMGGHIVQNNWLVTFQRVKILKSKKKKPTPNNCSK